MDCFFRKLFNFIFYITKIKIVRSKTINLYCIERIVPSFSSSSNNEFPISKKCSIIVSSQDELSILILFRVKRCFKGPSNLRNKAYTQRIRAELRPTQLLRRLFFEFIKSSLTRALLNTPYRNDIKFIVIFIALSIWFYLRIRYFCAIKCLGNSALIEIENIVHSNRNIFTVCDIQLLILKIFPLDFNGRSHVFFMSHSWKLTKWISSCNLNPMR